MTDTSQPNSSKTNSGNNSQTLGQTAAADPLSEYTAHSGAPDLVAEIDRSFQVAQLGVEAESFMRSNLGKYLVERANNDLDEATAELMFRTNPADAEKIIGLQIRGTVARNAIRYITEAINAGVQAEAALKQIEDENYGH